MSEFDLGTNYASATFNFVPNGSPVTVVRDVIRTQSCDRCHDQLSAHGGSRRGIEMCVLCHTPQTTDPDTGNTVNLPVMAHKIHMGSELPSVQAGKPYRIIGFQGSVTDWSTVVLPSDPRRCEVCHDQKSGATQATAYLTRPARVACGACHDDVIFATGANHAGGPQISDNQCSTCHIPQGELDFDASIKGAHLVPTDSTNLKGLVFQIQKVENGLAGQKPRVTFTVKDNSGAPIPLKQLEQPFLRDGRAHLRLRLYQFRLGRRYARLCFRECHHRIAVRNGWRMHLQFQSRCSGGRPWNLRHRDGGPSHGNLASGNRY